MNKQQLEELEGLALHDKPEKSLSDALDEYLEKSIERLDEMFLVICKTRASYIKARDYHKREDYTKSYENRAYGSAQLKSLYNLLTKNFITYK